MPKVDLGVGNLVNKSNCVISGAAPNDCLFVARSAAGGIWRVSQRENVLRSTFVGLLLLTGFYLMTAIVYDEGGFGVQLVVKPHPSLTLVVGGGEDGAWQREHPNEPKPWWLVANFAPFVIDDWEGGHPWWEEAYMLATLPCWLVLGGACVFRDLRHGRTVS